MQRAWATTSRSFSGVDVMLATAAALQMLAPCTIKLGSVPVTACGACPRTIDSARLSSRSAEG